MRGIPLDRPSRGNSVAVVARFLFDPSENRGYSGMKPTQNIGMKESVWERQRSEVGLGRNLRLGMLCAVEVGHWLPFQ